MYELIDDYSNSKEKQQHPDQHALVLLLLQVSVRSTLLNSNIPGALPFRKLKKVSLNSSHPELHSTYQENMGTQYRRLKKQNQGLERWLSG